MSISLPHTLVLPPAHPNIQTRHNNPLLPGRLLPPLNQAQQPLDPLDILRPNNATPIPDHAVCARVDEILEEGIVDALCDGAAEFGVDELAEGVGEGVEGEGEQGHCFFEVGEEGGVCGAAGGELFGGECEGGDDRAAGYGGGADQLNQLEAEESKVQGGVVVEQLQG